MWNLAPIRYIICYSLYYLIYILTSVYTSNCLKWSLCPTFHYLKLPLNISIYKSHISSLSSKLISKMQILSFLILYLYWTTLYMYHLSKIKLTQVVVYTVENSICDSDAYGWLLMINLFTFMCFVMIIIRFPDYQHFSCFLHWYSQNNAVKWIAE